VGKHDQGRTSLILEAGKRSALRYGDWALIPPYTGPAIQKDVNIELGNAPEYQLFNLKDDPGQQENLAQAQPYTLQRLIQEYNKLRSINTLRESDPLILQYKYTSGATRF